MPIQPRDAREASDVFYKQNQGDVSLNYENEVILTNEMYGENALPYVVPDNNVLVSSHPSHMSVHMTACCKDEVRRELRLHGDKFTCMLSLLHVLYFLKLCCAVHHRQTVWCLFTILRKGLLIFSLDATRGSR